LERARALVAELNALQGRLTGSRAEPAQLGERLDRTVTMYEQAADVLGGLGAYAFLAASTDRNDAAAQGFEATIRERGTTIAASTIWVTLEINQLEEAEIEAATAAVPAAARWRPW